MLTANIPLLTLLDQIRSGLDRKAAKTASRWTSSYVIVPDPKTRLPVHYHYRYHPWTKEMIDCDKSWVSPKAAQLGVTQIALGKALFEIDVKKNSVLYLLPKKNPDAVDFSRTRFDPVIDDSPYLKGIFSNVNNVGLKKAGAASLYIRGTMSKSGVKSLPVSLIIFDEFDEMPDATVAQAEQRSAGQFIKQSIKFSTPTLPGKKIDKIYKNTTQEHYFFKCPRCSQWTEFIFPDSLVIYADSPHDSKNLLKSHYRCEYGCDIFHHEKDDFLQWSKCQWRSTANSAADIRGFYINQFYSFTKTPAELAVESMLAEEDPAKEQEYWNSAGGMPRIPSGSNVSEEQILNLRGDHSNGDAPRAASNLITMGVDIGKVIHYVIIEWLTPTVLGQDLNSSSTAIVRKYGRIEGLDSQAFETLAGLIREWRVNSYVTDANPETRKSIELANQFPGYVRLCLYLKGISAKNIQLRDDEHIIAVDRTTWLDTTFSRFHGKRIILPHDLDREYKDHLQSLVKVYRADKTGNVVARYENQGADHYAHAHNYAEIALPFAAANTENGDISAYI